MKHTLKFIIRLRKESTYLLFDRNVRIYLVSDSYVEQIKIHAAKRNYSYLVEVGAAETTHARKWEPKKKKEEKMEIYSESRIYVIFSWNVYVYLIITKDESVRERGMKMIDVFFFLFCQNHVIRRFFMFYQSLFTIWNCAEKTSTLHGFRTADLLFFPTQENVWSFYYVVAYAGSWPIFMVTWFFFRVRFFPLVELEFCVCFDAIFDHFLTQGVFFLGIFALLCFAYGLDILALFFRRSKNSDRFFFLGNILCLLFHLLCRLFCCLCFSASCAMFDAQKNPFHLYKH